MIKKVIPWAAITLILMLAIPYLALAHSPTSNQIFYPALKRIWWNQPVKVKELDLTKADTYFDKESDR